jgi:hypothetical protein
MSVRMAVLDANGNLLVSDGNRFARFLPSGAADLSFGQNQSGVTGYFGYGWNDFALAPTGRS